MTLMKPLAITGLGAFVPQHTHAANLFRSLYFGGSLLKRVQLGVRRSAVELVSSPVEEAQFVSLERVFPCTAGPGISRSAKMAVYAAHQAVKDADFSPVSLGGRVGLFVGCNKNLTSLQTLMDLWKAKVMRSCSERRRDLIQAEIAQLHQHQAAYHIANYLGIRGRVMTYGDACTAAATAIISGQRRILSGELDFAICGASEHATHQIIQLTFARFGVLNLNVPEIAGAASRPFDKDRAGFTLADGAAFIVLESVEHAKKRGANIHAFLSGSSRQSEARKLTSPDPSGYSYAKCMRQAMATAGLESADIQHINAHGTATPSNDVAEGHAIHTLFGNRSGLGKRIATTVTSTKSALGHSLGASGAVEAVLCVQSLLQQKVLPTLNYFKPGAGERSLNIVTHGREQHLDNVLSNSFGFGGENASLVFSRNMQAMESNSEAGIP